MKCMILGSNHKKENIRMNRKYRKTVIAGNWKMNQLASGVKPFI